MRVYEPWMDYMVIGEHGWDGIREDAPQWAKDAYQAYIDNQEYTEDGFLVRT